MVSMTFEQVLEAAEQLDPQEQAALITYLQIRLPQRSRITREDILAEFERRKAAGAFQHAKSLYGAYAPTGDAMSEDELNAYLRHIRTAWETEMEAILADD